MVSSISFNGPLIGVGTECGYGYAAVELITAWQRQNVPVWWGKEESPIAFSFGQPEWYEWQRDDQIKIGYTPWESTRLPMGWPKRMNEMDEVWVPCIANKNWLINNGVYKRVRVLPHGLNSAHYPAKRRRIGPEEPFRFLHIGEPAPRKGGRLVYDAFCDLYADNPQYHLTIKGAPRFTVEASNITVIDYRITQEELVDLYHNHHAFIYPTNGEGFGFLPFQAAATGMPTLVTNWSGPADYMESCWPLKLKGLTRCEYEPHEGSWADPSLDDLRLWMGYFAEAPNYFFDKAYRRALSMPKKWNWDLMAKLSLSWFEEILATKP